MKRIAQHKILVAGDSFDHCSEQVRRFFDLTSLVIYDCIEISEKQSISALDADFFQQIDDAEKSNLQTVQSLIRDLEKSGIATINNLQKIEQGYISKTLHILSHFMDGFIGIDSYFYNLLDDSHWLIEQRSTTIRNNPSPYWLLHLDCFSLSSKEAGILHL
ncbi:MAG: hypothetical protein GY702_05750 [Desulfobulbaceae bacterium]|nr:hypothetical protein [Desulfobulbaceae bacterium]